MGLLKMTQKRENTQTFSRKWRNNLWVFFSFVRFYEMIMLLNPMVMTTLHRT